ncbi:MAG: rod-binding protein [Hyphomicrobiaceae bacterium]
MRKANQEFEAAALQVMLAPMFSRKDSKLFGEGVAGKYWQSMLSEQIARQIATSGRLHLMPVAGGRRLPQTRRNPIGAMAVPACKGQGCPEKGGWTTRVQRVSQEAP